MTDSVESPAAAPGPWSGIGIVALYFLLQAGFGVLFSAGVGFALAIRARLAGGSPHAQAGAEGIARTLQSNPDFRVVLTFVTLSAAAVTTALAARMLWPVQWSRADLPGFGLARTHGYRVYTGAIGLGIVVMLLGGALTMLLSHGHPVQQDISALAHSVSPGMRVLLVVLAVVIAPFIEELAFRGVLLSGFASRMPVTWAVALSAVIFGAAHLPDFGFAWFPVPELFLLGVALAWIRIRARSLWPSIATHATFNLIATVGGFFLTHPPQ